MWAGYDSNNALDSTLHTALCPHSFCSYNSSSFTASYTLPGVANNTILSDFICRDGRTGKLCGGCKSGYSVHFHSPNYDCKMSRTCSIGWLLYIISELVPLTLIFAFVLRFNISFTSGTLTGFLFYAQVIDILSVGQGDTSYPEWTISLIKASNFVYGFFNLNFFDLYSLSFCLWEGASTLDAITFKFITVTFAFLLVLTVFLIMNICTHKKCRKFF